MAAFDVQELRGRGVYPRCWSRPRALLRDAVQAVTEAAFAARTMFKDEGVVEEFYWDATSEIFMHAATRGLISPATGTASVTACALRRTSARCQRVRTEYRMACAESRVCSRRCVPSERSKALGWGPHDVSRHPRRVHLSHLLLVTEASMVGTRDG